MKNNFTPEVNRIADTIYAELENCLANPIQDPTAMGYAGIMLQRGLIDMLEFTQIENGKSEEDKMYIIKSILKQK